MDENILKLFMMVAIGWAVTFLIRLFPFLLPHSKKGGTSRFTSLYNDIAAPLIIASLTVNILFSRNKVPNLFGRYIYIVDVMG